jgi:hypothetical protein
MTKQLSHGLWAATAAAVMFAWAASTAVAQGPEIKQQIQESAAANKERLAHYTWQEQQTVSLKGDVKGQTLYQVRNGPDGKPQKTDLSPPPPPPSGGRVKKHVVEKKKNEYKEYAQQIAQLVQTYVPPNGEKLKAAFQQGNGALSMAGPGAVQVAFTNYNMQGDSMTLVFNKAEKSIQSVNVSSYLNNDPSDAATFSAQFSKLPDGTNYMSSATVNGVKKQLTIQIQNTNYQPL